jgi:hypothetical protein
MAGCGNQMPAKVKALPFGVFKNPKVVIDIPTWGKAAKKGENRNIVMDYKTGNPIVLNPENMKEVLKTIEVPRAVDSYRGLDTFRNSADKATREKYNIAIQNYNKQRADREELVAIRNEDLQKAYVDLAQAIGNYRVSPSAEAAIQVALAQKAMLSRENQNAPRAPKGNVCDLDGPCERIVKNFDYPMVPSGNVPPPPINVYVKYESMGDTREIDYKTALAAPQSEAESL